VDKLEKAQIQGQVLLGNPPVGPKPRAQQGPEPLHRVDVNFVEAITIFVPCIFPGVVADGLVLKAPFRSAIVDGVLVGQYQGSRPNRGLDQGPNRGLAYVL